MNLLSTIHPSQDAVRSNILSAAAGHLHNGIAQIVLFPERAARLLISNTSLKILGTLAILSATAWEKTGANDWVMKNITAPLLTDVWSTDKDVPFPVQAVVRLKNRADAEWRSSFHPEHIHANTPTVSMSSSSNDSLDQLMKQLRGDDNMTMDEFRATHPEYQK